MKRVLVVVAAAVAAALSGCGGATAVRTSTGVTTTTIASAHVAPTPCALTDLRAIEARTSSHLGPAAIGPGVGRWVMSHDAKSFVARVAAGDLTAAGIDTSPLPQTETVTLVVNHGDFPASSLPIGGGAPAGDGASGAGSTTPSVSNWVLYVLSGSTDRPLIFQAAPAGPCFRG